MSDQVSLSQPNISQWRELRDDRGRLYGRIDERQLLLEVRRNHDSMVFDLRDYIEALRGLEIEADIE